MPSGTITAIVKCTIAREALHSEGPSDTTMMDIVVQSRDDSSYRPTKAYQ